MEEVLPRHDIICRIKVKTVSSGLLYVFFISQQEGFFFLLLVLNEHK